MFKHSLPTLNTCGRRLLSVQQAARYDFAKLEKKFREPFEYVKSVPYKHPTLLVPIFNHWLEAPKEKVDYIQEASWEWITWAVLIDDIRDNSQFRHGVPTANRVFGVGATINAASRALFKIQKQVMELGHPLLIIEPTDHLYLWLNAYSQSPKKISLSNTATIATRRESAFRSKEYFYANIGNLMELFDVEPLDYKQTALKLFMERSEEAFYGEDIDTYWSNEYIIPSEEAYIEMTKIKGGAYFLLPIQLLQLFSSNKTNYNDLVISIGSYYEILDDYYNLFHPKALKRLALKEQENHGTNSDITEGKISLATIHASQFPDVATEIADILIQRTSDPKLQNRFVSLLKKHGSDEYMRTALRNLEADIRAQINQLGDNPQLTAFMDDISFQSHDPPPERELYL